MKRESLRKRIINNSISLNYLMLFKLIKSILLWIAKSTDSFFKVNYILSSKYLNHKTNSTFFLLITILQIKYQI